MIIQNEEDYFLFVSGLLIFKIRDKRFFFVCLPTRQLEICFPISLSDDVLVLSYDPKKTKRGALFVTQDQFDRLTDRRIS